jgi:hypothetical protein
VKQISISSLGMIYSLMSEFALYITHYIMLYQPSSRRLELLGHLQTA